MTYLVSGYTEKVLVAKALEMLLQSGTRGSEENKVIEQMLTKLEQALVDMERQA